MDTTRDPPELSQIDPSLAPIGAYRLLRQLGEGGFGVVYEAEQTSPVRRRVALKLIKPGMDSASVVARFEAERQALAVMDHPCIAKVFDGGVTDAASGSRPYFVMELVRGEAITDFCDRHTLSIEARLDLFARVCDAVQHAHAKGVVHRDLKPSNVLVAYDGDGNAQPKVIDFGVARALHARLTDRSIFTERGQLIGTPEYMSPEQAEMSGLDIDTRSDLYSLGVILYELLTGVRPFESETLRRAGIAEIQRIIREVDPERPSTKLASLMSSSDDPRTATRVAQARRTELRSLTSVLRRDLDWVVMRCLEKDRERRYSAASALAEDVRRYLRHEPVEAGPPGAGYRLAKFVRRNRGAVVGASAGIAALVVGLAVLGMLLQRVRSERDRGERLISFLEGSILSPALIEDAGRNATVWEALDGAAEEAREAFAEDGPTRARVLGAIGGSRLHLGDDAGALESLTESVESGAGDGANAWSLRATIDLGEALGRAGRFEEALRVLDALHDAKDERIRAEAMAARAAVLKWSGKLDAAEEEYVRAVAAWSAIAGASAEETLGARYDLALVALERGKAARAEGDDAGGERWFRSALEAMLEVRAAQSRSLGADHAGTLKATLEAASLHSRLGEFDRAAPLFEEAIEGMTRRLGASHWRTLQARANVGSMRYRAGDYAGAIAAYAPVLDAYRATGRIATRDAFVVAKAKASAHENLGNASAGIADLIEVHRAVVALGESSSVSAPEVAREIARLLRASGDDDAAARWEKPGA